MNTNQILKNQAAELTDDQILSALDLLDAKADITADERMVKAAMSDAFTERHNLDEAMDAIYEDLDFAGTYTDAIRLALTAKVAA